MIDNFFGLAKYGGLTLPELKDLAVKRAEAGVACQQSKGDSCDFIRKRKKAFHRAIKRGSYNSNVIQFAVNLAVNNSLNNLAVSLYASSIYDHVTRPMTGLMQWLPTDDRTKDFITA